MHFLQNNNNFKSSVTSTKQLSAILKNRLGDYHVIISSSPTNQRREFSIITYVIILKVPVNVPDLVCLEPLSARVKR